MMAPDEVQRVEVIEYPGLRRRLGIRVYTRDFVRDMVRGQAELVVERIAMRGPPEGLAGPSWCR